MEDTHSIDDTLQNYNNAKAAPEPTAGKNELVALRWDSVLK